MPSNFCNRHYHCYFGGGNKPVKLEARANRSRLRTRAAQKSSRAQRGADAWAGLPLQLRKQADTGGRHYGEADHCCFPKQSCFEEEPTCLSRAWARSSAVAHLSLPHTAPISCTLMAAACSSHKTALATGHSQKWCLRSGQHTPHGQGRPEGPILAATGRPFSANRRYTWKCLLSHLRFPEPSQCPQYSISSNIISGRGWLHCWAAGVWMAGL
jgi:hypothetical protein